MSNGLLIREMSEHERPRERMAELGAEALSDVELMAILLRTGTKGASALQIGAELLRKFERLEHLARASLDDLRQTKGIGRDKAIALKAAFTLAQRMARELRRDSPPLDTPDRVADFLREDCRNLEVETCWVLLLNTRRGLIRAERVSQGLLDSILVHPREVYRRAISANAAAIILAHNHPSGNATPSDSDIKVTRDLVRAGQVLRIELLDHVIVGRAASEGAKDYVSLRELGYCAA